MGLNPGARHGTPQADTLPEACHRGTTSCSAVRRRCLPLRHMQLCADGLATAMARLSLPCDPWRLIGFSSGGSWSLATGVTARSTSGAALSRKSQRITTELDEAKERGVSWPFSNWAIAGSGSNPYWMNASCLGKLCSPKKWDGRTSRSNRQTLWLQANGLTFPCC
jgi:hypothetical protein